MCRIAQRVAQRLLKSVYQFPPALFLLGVCYRPQRQNQENLSFEEVMTTYERLKILPQAESYLRPGVTLEKLGTIANQMSNNEFAERMVKARSNLFE